MQSEKQCFRFFLHMKHDMTGSETGLEDPNDIYFGLTSLLKWQASGQVRRWVVLLLVGDEASWN